MLNIDGVAGSAGNGTSGGGGAGSTANKYKTSNASTTDRAMSGVGRGPSVFQTQVAHATPPTLPDLEDGDVDKKADGLSVISGHSDHSRTTSQLEEATKLPWYRSVTCKDLKDIMPTVLILVGGILICVLVIPYAFSSVLKQLDVVGEMDRIAEYKKELARNATIEAALKKAEANAEPTPEDSIAERLISSDPSLPFSEEVENT